MNGPIAGGLLSHRVEVVRQPWIARSLTNSFSVIAPADAPMLIVAEFAGALAGPP